jgi:hypothetical protein
MAATEIERADMSNADLPIRARALLIALFWFSNTLFAADEPDYRLAGIVTVGTERLLAVIEMPDGRQGLFRTGDALGEGRIRDITRSDVRIEMHGQNFLLSLRGNPRLSAAAPIRIEDEDVSDSETNTDPTVRNQPLFYEDTVRLLTSVERSGGTANAGGATAGQGTDKSGNTDTLSPGLNELLGVPQGARIVAVDGSPVHSPQEIIDKVVPLLNLGRAVRLNLADADQLEVIYVTPVQED